MKRVLPTILALVLLAGCRVIPEMGARYGAERDLWKANQELRRQSIRPDLVLEPERRRLAERFENIGRRYMTVPAAVDSSAAGVARGQVRGLAGRALSRSAAMFVALGDTAHAHDLYREIETVFGDNPITLAGGALSRGQLAEVEGNIEEALEAYQLAVDSVAPRSGSNDTQSAVLQLPLRIARLRAVEGGDNSEAALRRVFDPAIEYYRLIMAEQPGTLTAFEARSRLVDIYTDIRDWESALVELRALEQASLAFPEPVQDPGQLRVAQAEALRLGLGREAEALLVMESVADDYPQSSYAARSLLYLARQDMRASKLDRALTRLDRLAADYADDEDVSAEERLERARVYRLSDRWSDALEVYRSLPVEHPLSEPALQSHLEIVGYYDAGGDAAARGQALEEAERAYQSFLERYPSETHANSAREKLARVLRVRKRYGEAMAEYVTLGESLAGSPQGGLYLLTAAEIASEELKDDSRALELLDRVAAMLPNHQLGQTAAAEAAKIREAGSR